jgi:hypothetical protein
VDVAPAPNARSVALDDALDDRELQAEQLDAEITMTRGGGTGFELTFAAAAS